MNKAILIGNVVRPPVVRETQSGLSVANFDLATNERYTDAAGNRVQKAEFHRIVCWRKLAENVRDYLTKGRLVQVEGRIETRRYTDQQGVERFATNIVAQRVEFLGARPKDEPEDIDEDEAEAS